jgi:hypothetical protein
LRRAFVNALARDFALATANGAQHDHFSSSPCHRICRCRNAEFRNPRGFANAEQSFKISRRISGHRQRQSELRRLPEFSATIGLQNGRGPGRDNRLVSPFSGGVIYGVDQYQLGHFGSGG